MNKGLPSDFVYDIFQDSKGFMWLATDAGLCRYDGFEFKSYNNPEQTSKAGSQIKEDKYGRIWYENFDGYLYYVQNDELHKLENQTAVGYNDYSIINDHIIIVSKNGIDLFNLKNFKFWKTISLDNKNTGSVIDVVNGLLIHKSSVASLVNYKGELQSINQSDCFKKYNEFPANISIKIGNSNYCINGVNSESYCFKYRNNEIISCFNVDNKSLIQNAFAADNQIWVCTSNGVICYDTNGVCLNKNERWLSEISINCGYQSNDNTYWFGTAGKGLLILRDISTRMFLPGTAVTKLEIKDKELLVGTRNDDVLLFNPASGETNNFLHSESNHSVDLIKYSPLDKTLYIVDDYLNVYDFAGNNNIRARFGVKDIELIDSSYTAIAASGIVALRRTNLKAGPSPYDSLFNSSPTNKIGTRGILLLVRAKSIARFKNDLAFYVSGNMGLYRFDPKGAKEVLRNNKQIFLSKIESGGDILVALGTNGLLWSIDRQNNFTLIDSSSSVRNIFVCDSLLCVDFRTELRFYTINQQKLISIGKSYQLSDQIFDMKLLGKSLYLSTFKGLLRININDINKKSNPPLFYINSVKLKDTTLYSFHNQTLLFDQNDLEISFSLLDFKKLDQHVLDYCINNNEWKELPANTRVLRLAALAGGTYEIKFRIDGKVKEDATIKFSILIPWWKQWWFVLACFLIALTIIVVYYRWQTGVLNRKNQLLVQKIELEKNLNQSMLTSIKAQMNPHFFYNALNTIQSYIFTDDKKNATNYLSKFSKLTRVILEMSGKESISLNEELSALQLYLDLEKVRFSGDFEFVLDAKKVNADLIRIPSMIIQPFVENAIKHGLLHKKGRKILKVSFELIDGLLQVVIDDNGIGRKRAGELNKIRDEKHDSFSTSANAKRLEILNQGRNSKVGFTINDKYNNDGVSEGTTVIIQIPI